PASSLLAAPTFFVSPGVAFCPGGRSNVPDPMYHRVHLLPNLFTRGGSVTHVCALIGLVMLCSWAPSFAGQAPSRSEKTERSAAQQKINSQLLYEIYRRRGEAERKGVPPGSTGVKIDARGRALVDVR